MTLPEAAKADGVSAYQPTPSGAVIRARDYRDGSGEWREAVEVVDGDIVVELFSSSGTLPVQVYNRVVAAFTDLEESELLADAPDVETAELVPYHY